MTAGDSVGVSALRSALGAIDNAEAVDRPHASGKPRLGVGSAEVARRELSSQEVVDVLRAEVADRTAAASEFERFGRSDQAASLKAEAAALAAFLEQALKAE